MSSVTNGTNTVSEQEYYEYDSVGNITGIYKIEENEKVYYNRYYYDEANQIVREDNRLGEFTSVYTYDVGGNIVSRIRYPYTEGEITGLTATETHTYSYDNPQWGDVLTSYNGQPVTYDAMGNITSLNGDTYIWTAGRQLSRITKADNSYIDYFYDDNGQLSMYKMYDADNTLEGGSEYFWEGTKLIAVRLIESENATDGMTGFMRIIYDSDGEPLGFLLNDAMPFLYTKNILGDITGVVNYENAEYLFRYAYDAYGNYELIPPDDSAGAEIIAIMFHALNPLTYRGYIFTPAIGISHYLGSRFYVPQLCRFMNADVYVDTAQGVVGTNMFAYCNNNPVSFVDPMGTEPVATITIIMAIFGAIMGLLVGYRIVSAKNYTVEDGWEFWQYILGGIVIGGVAGGILGYTAGVFFTNSGQIISATGKTLTNLNYAKMAEVRRLGQIGERLAGITKNTKHITSLTKTAKYRIPDILDTTYKIIGDVKYVKSLSYTKQLQDFYLYAKQNGYTFILKIKPETKLSKQLRELIDAGEIIIEFITKE